MVGSGWAGGQRSEVREAERGRVQWGWGAWVPARHRAGVPPQLERPCFCVPGPPSSCIVRPPACTSARGWRAGVRSWLGLTPPSPPHPPHPAQVVFLPSGPGGSGPTRGKDANMGLPAQMAARDDPTAEPPVEKQVGPVAMGSRPLPQPANQSGLQGWPSLLGDVLRFHMRAGRRETVRHALPLPLLGPRGRAAAPPSFTLSTCDVACWARPPAPAPTPHPHPHPAHVPITRLPLLLPPTFHPLCQEVAKKPYQFLLVNVLREYLERDLGVPTPFPLDKERLFDDFGERTASHPTPPPFHLIPPSKLQLPCACTLWPAGVAPHASPKCCMQCK